VPGGQQGQIYYQETCDARALEEGNVGVLLEEKGTQECFGVLAGLEVSV